MLTAKLLKMYYTTQTVPTLLLKQQIPVLDTVRNISFLSTILELYSEITLSQKPFRIGHMYITLFLLRLTNNMTSQNNDLSSWEILYILSCIDIGVWRYGLALLIGPN
jgi:hypothetical protein